MGQWCSTEDDRARRQCAEAVRTLQQAKQNIEVRLTQVTAARQMYLTRLHAVPKSDAAQRRFLLRTLRDYDRQRNDHYDLLESVGASVRRLEDAQILSPTIDALRHGTRMRRTIDIDQVQTVVDRAIDHQQRIADVYSILGDASLDDVVDSTLTDEDVEQQIEHLLRTEMPSVKTTTTTTTLETYDPISL